MRQSSLIPIQALLIGLAVAFFVILTFIVPAENLLAVMDNLFIGVVGAVTIVYMPLIQRALTDKKFDRVSQLSLGIVFTWVSMIGTKIASLYVTTPASPIKAINVYILSALAYLAVLGGTLHVTAPGMINSEWKYNKKPLYLGIAVGIALSIISGCFSWD